MSELIKVELRPEEIATLAGWHIRIAREMSQMTGADDCVHDHEARAEELRRIIDLKRDIWPTSPPNLPRHEGTSRTSGPLSEQA